MNHFSRSKLAWYIYRLNAMSLRELLHRCREWSLRATGRLKRRRWPEECAMRARPVHHVGALFDTDRVDADVRLVVEREAARVRACEFELLGQRWLSRSAWPQPSAFWHVAPDECVVPDYALGYFSDVLSRSAAEGRDLKRLWEINRLQFLVPLAVAARHSGAEADRNLVFETVFAWMKANPPFTGLSFSAGIELALRLISVALALSILGDEHLSCDERMQLASFFRVHEDWLVRFPSLHSSRNNHRVAELAGLLVCAVILDFGSDVKQRRLTALTESLVEQFHSDGVGAEQSPTYAAFSIEVSLLAFAFARNEADDCPPELPTRLRGWANFTRWSMDQAGRVPEIGDNDAGRGLAMTQAQESRYVASVLAMLAAWLRCPDMSPPSRDPHLRDGLFGSNRHSRRTETGLKTWPSGGYSIFRGDNASFVLILDHGPLGHFGIAAHGHADALAVWLTVGETPVLVDAGTATYQAHHPFRDRFRHTLAHNTLTVAGASSSIMAGAFNWSFQAQVRSTNRTETSVTAIHDGYARRFGVIHQRRILLVDPLTIRIEDRLIGVEGRSRARMVRSNLVFGRACDVRSAGRRQWVLSAGTDVLATIRTVGPLQYRLFDADHEDAAECATTFGVTHRTSRLVGEGILEEGACQITTIAMCDAAATRCCSAECQPPNAGRI